MEDLLLLDSAIRDWVLVPIVAVMFIVAILRSNITRLLQSDKKTDLKSIQQSQTLLRAKRLIVNGHKLPPATFEARRALFCDKDRGILAVKGDPSVQAPNPMMNPMMSDPSHMMDMMKNNMAMIVPQVLLMGWVSYFFTGFVAVKLPFPLTVRFKALLQRGIELASLDVSYVSALSWYFLVLFGLRGVIALALGEGQVIDDTKVMQQQMDASAMMQQMDSTKIYTSERENVELVHHTWVCDGVTERLLGTQPPNVKQKKDQ